MLRIRPVTEEQASQRVQETYHDIKSTLLVSQVPLLFQYIANFEEYLIYMWGKIKINIQTPYFENAYKETVTFTNQAVPEIYSPSASMTQFVHQLHPQEKEHVEKTIAELEVLNAKLMVITIGLREGVKGVIIGQDELQQLDVSEYKVDIFDIFHTKYDAESTAIEPASKMLAPLFGQQALMISQYPAFFQHAAQEMETLVKHEAYLHKRVELERLGMHKAFGLPYTLGTSYQEIMAYAGHKPHLNELIYILAETFPSQFPRLLITTAVMKIALLGKFPLSTK